MSKINYRIHTDVIKEQLIVLSNLESINAELLKQELPQNERLVRLNQTAITQIKSLIDNPSVKKLSSK